MIEILKTAPEETDERSGLITVSEAKAVEFYGQVQQLTNVVAQMGEILIRIQHRLDELEEKERCATLTHEEVNDVKRLIRIRAAEYADKYQISTPGNLRSIGAAIKKAVLNRYGAKDLHDVPAIARQAVEAQISRWSDIRLAMKCREKMRSG